MSNQLLLFFSFIALLAVLLIAVQPLWERFIDKVFPNLDKLQFAKKEYNDV